MSLSGTKSPALDVIFEFTGIEDVGTWSSGDNATFLGGGTLAGTFAKDISTALNGASYKYTQAASSLDDYIASPAQSVPLRFRGNMATMIFSYTYDGGDSDIEPVVWDVTNGAKLTSASNLLPGKSSPAGIYRANVLIPLTCTQIRIGFHVKVLNSGKILNFDDVQLTADTTKYADPSMVTEWQSFTPTGTWTTNSTYAGKFRRVGSDLEIYYNIDLAGAPDATNLSVDLPSGYVIDTTKIPSASNFETNFGFGIAWDTSAGLAYDIKGVYRDTTRIYISPADSSGAYLNFSNALTNTIPTTFASGDNVSVTFKVPVLGLTAANPMIVTAAESFSTDTASLVYAGSATYTLSTLANAPVGTFITYTYAGSTNTITQTTTAPTQTTSDMNTNGIRVFTRLFSAASTAASPARVEIQIGKGFKGISCGVYKNTSKTTTGTLTYFVSGSDSSGIRIYSYDEVTGVFTIDAGLQTGSVTSTALILFSDITTQNNGYFVINASKSPALVGVPQVLPMIATISDVKTSGTAGGTFTSGAWQTRTLNTLSDTSNIGITLASNQFTLPAGEYYIEASAPSYSVSNNKAKLRNITDSTDDILGTSEFTSTSSSTARSIIAGRINISSSKTFEIQHQCSSTQASNGFGGAVSFGVSEVYTVVKITKVK